MKRVLFSVIGAILMLFGLAIAGTGGTLTSIVGPSGEASTDVGKITGNGYALVLNDFAVNTFLDKDSVDNLGEFNVGAKSQTSNQIFIGIAPTKVVNEYLSGSARGVVSDLQGGSARVIPIPGPVVPKAPADQNFWLVQAQGAAPSVSLSQSGPNTTVVVMNVVPSKPVVVDMTLGFASSSLFPIGLLLIIVGVLLLVLGVFLLVRGLRGSPKPPPSGTPPGAASPIAEPPVVAATGGAVPAASTPATPSSTSAEEIKPEESSKSADTPTTPPSDQPRPAQS